ncbi:CHAT domain-containing protein [filamentous cyanobacterium LEGE 11480]|uniref:CHAT domain-containing protein n=1 Tax=Romeriopsis navalis LEGE 11480 TaxID=2777977 RepID=A0A928VI49_9CYAN|nr:CHAT domain-containing protein [Romeriopsis navalis]MBE9029038.1 CHAT domain-containing protein [Romeriopsis navalis LEGE 11480]
MSRRTIYPKILLSCLKRFIHSLVIRSGQIRNRFQRYMLLAGLALLFGIGTHLIPSPLTQPTVEAMTPANVVAIKASLQTAQQQYQTAQYDAAARSIQATMPRLIDSQRAQALNLLSLTYQKLGRWQAAQSALDRSIQLIQQTAPLALQAQLLNTQGQLSLATGKAEVALERWQAATSLYQQSGDRAGAIGSQINQAQALQELGFYRRAADQLTALETQILELEDSAIKVVALYNLGNMQRQANQLVQSIADLQQSRVIAERLNLPKNIAAIDISLGNTYQVQAARFSLLNQPKDVEQSFQKAFDAYQQAATITADPLLQAQAKISQFQVLLETTPQNIQTDFLVGIDTALTQLPVSRSSIYAEVNFANGLLQLQPAQNAEQLAESLLKRADRQAVALKDPRAKAYALGIRGKLREQQNDFATAQIYTRQALQTAQTIDATDLAYQWQWQMGRIIQAQSNQINTAHPEALSYYQAAIENLRNLRSDIVALNPEVQFAFREQVEPIYRQYVDLLLRDEIPSVQNLQVARSTIEALQLAELDNFFQDACAQSKAINVDNVDPKAAVVYPIVLPDRLEIVAKIPGQADLQHFRQRNIAASQIETQVERLRQRLARRSSSIGSVKQVSQQLYDWLVAPMQSTLTDETQTLVFVMDGALRNIPPSILYDGQQYLIERYAVAMTPGLQLLSPQPLSNTNFSALLAGASNAPSFRKEGLGSIANVQQELDEVSKRLTTSQQLADQQFLRRNIQQQINDRAINIVHIATHGKFSSNPEETYILDWQERIQVKDLDTLLRNNIGTDTTPIELLILSACETAKGDKRAALGLAGVAIRAGARSTLASLFQVNDASTAQLMLQFYQNLSQGKITKAEALRQAQISFLKSTEQDPLSEYNRPYFWAPFILIGNWL